MCAAATRYTANGAAELIKEIVAQIKTDDLEILFRMDNEYFDDDIIETIESSGFQYLIKGKEYPTLASQVTAPTISFMKGEEGRETRSLLQNWTLWTKTGDLLYLAYRNQKNTDRNYLFWKATISNTSIL